MSWSEVKPMAVKKKTSSPSKPAASPKAAPKKSAPKKSAPKKSAPKKSTMPAEAKSKPAGAPKGVAKKAPAIKLSDAQVRVLSAVSQTNEAGYVGTKAEGRILEALLKKKLIKKGKKEAGGASRYLVTKAGVKHVPPPPAPSAPVPAPAPAAEASTPPPPPATV
jgi:hypothetical protein